MLLCRKQPLRNFSTERTLAVYGHDPPVQINNQSLNQLTLTRSRPKMKFMVVSILAATFVTVSSVALSPSTSTTPQSQWFACQGAGEGELVVAMGLLHKG